MGGNGWEKPFHEYPAKAGVPQSSILDLQVSCCILIIFLMMLSVISLSMLMILYPKYDLASDLWQQLELASGLEFNLRDTADWDKQWHVEWFHFLILVAHPLFILIFCMIMPCMIISSMIFLSPFLVSRWYKDVYATSFFPCAVRLWNYLPAECFPLTYDLNGFPSIDTFFLWTLSKQLSNIFFFSIFWRLKCAFSGNLNMPLLDGQSFHFLGIEM